MLSRALSSAAVMLFIVLAALPAEAQNLEAGKTPSQIFANTCAVCHRSSRGLLKTVTARSLPGFLRQHYTTSSDMASALSAYVVSNGAADSRLGGGLTKQGKESTSEPKPGATPQAEAPTGRKLRPGTQEAARPDADGLAPADAGTRTGRNGKRLSRPAQDNPDAAKPADGEPPAATAEGPRSRQKLGRKGRPGRDDTPKPDTARDEPKGETPKSDTAKTESPAASSVKDDTAKTDSGKAADEAKGDAAGSGGTPGEPPALRADPVPAVTPAPKAPETPSTPATTVTSAPASSVDTPPAAPPPSPPAASPPQESATSAAVTSAPPSAPVAPAGPPAPPISQ